MSPTAAIVILNAAPGGSVSGAGVIGGGGGAAGCGSSIGGDVGIGVLAHAASTSGNKTLSADLALVTEPNSQNVYLGSAQATSEHIQFVEIIGRADTYTMVGFVVDRYALNA